MTGIEYKKGKTKLKLYDPWANLKNGNKISSKTRRQLQDRSARRRVIKENFKKLSSNKSLYSIENLIIEAFK